MARSADLRRLRDLVASPKETLEIELKNWLDLSSSEGRAILAQALLALANHGGGWVLIGFDDSGECASPAPEDLRQYSQDAVNGIVKKFAEPGFHCDVELVGDPGSEHPVISVPGGHRVPIRARAGGPGNQHVRQDTYYIRRPGPESAPIATGREWDELISRCLHAARGDLLERLQTILSGVVTEPSQSARGKAEEWDSACRRRFESVVERELPNERPSRYHFGFWTFSYIFEPNSGVSLAQLKTALERAEGSETGWPVWMCMNSEDLAPYPHDGTIECWLHRAERDAAHSDFWRASPDGRLFLLRGHQEDSEDVERVPPGSAFEISLPIWRVGECLLHCSRMATGLDIPDATAHVVATWTGLAGRRLGNFFMGWRSGAETDRTRQSQIRSQFSIVANEIPDRLVDLVHTTTQPLYEAFSFHQVGRATVVSELDKLRRRAPR
jgi:hypothetical protein